MLIDGRRRQKLEALATGHGGAGGLLAFLSEPVAQLPWGQEATPGQELVEVARSMPEPARVALAVRLLGVVAAHACGDAPVPPRAAEEAAFAVGMLEADVETDALRRTGTSATDSGVRSHALRSAYVIEGRRGPLDAPDPFWVGLLSSADRMSRACAAHAVLSRSRPESRDAALLLGLAADLDRTSLATLAHRWATAPPRHAPDLPEDLRASLAAALSDSGHDPDLADVAGVFRG